MQLSVLASLVLCHQGHKQLTEAAEIFRSTASNIEWSFVRLTTADGTLLVIVIPGTNDIPDIRMDIDIIRSAVRPKEGIHAYSEDGGGSDASLLDSRLVLPYASAQAQVTWPEQRVHRGFYRGYLSIRDELLAQVSGTDEQILIVGHSLGGAVGVLAAVDLNFNLSRDIHLVTLGSPRVGNAAFIEACQRRIASHTRLVHGWDPVPRHPWPIWGYRHHTAARHIGRRPIPLIPDIRHHLIASYDAMLARLNI
jgi:hypothetical protein